MGTTTIPLTAISVQSAKPATRYGSLATVPLASSGAQMLARPTLTGIPSGAIITTAYLEIRQYAAWSGTQSLVARAATAAWSTATTWDTRPGTTTTNAATVSKTGIVSGSLWQFDVTQIVQSWMSGTLARNGFVIFTSAGTTTVRGQAASSLRPQLVVTYNQAPLAPTGLNPTGGAVSKNKPTLTFEVSADIQSVQVQVDAAANATTPAFDSGEIVTTAGLVDLSATAYAGLADGATTQWRARAKNALGWSSWSAWVSFSRAAWKALTVTSPGTTSEDPSPTLQATYAGTITAWEAFTRDATGTVVQNSRWTAGSTVSYGTTKSVGASGKAVVRIRDNVDRVATPGDPEYLEASVSFTVTPSGTPAAFTALTGTADGIRPYVYLTGTRSAIPDTVVVYRDDELIARVTGASSFTGTTFSFTDKTAPMNTTSTYRVYAVTNGQWSNASSNAAVIARCSGIWIIDPDDGSEVVIWGAEDQDQEQPEFAIEHTPISGDKQVVRRRLARYSRQGSIEGDLITVNGISAATSEANLRNWISQDAGHLYRLLLGNRSDSVILGNIQLLESPLNGRERILGVTLDWWRQD